MALGFFSPGSIYLRWLRNGLLLVALVAALVTTGFFAGLSKSDWASWVQAVGSIVAIIGSAIGLVWQHRRQVVHTRKLELQAELRRYRALLAIVNSTVHVCRSIKNRTVKADRNDLSGYLKSTSNSQRELAIYQRALSEARPLTYDRGGVGDSLLRLEILLADLVAVLADGSDALYSVLAGAFAVHEAFEGGRLTLETHGEVIDLAIKEIDAEIARI